MHTPPNQNADPNLPDRGTGQGPGGGRWTSQERFAARCASDEYEPSPGWENAIRNLEDMLSNLD